MLSRLCVFMPLGRNVKGFKYWWMRENWPPWHIFWTCRLFIFLRWKGFRRMEWARAYTFTHARARTEKKSKRWVDGKRGVEKGEKWWQAIEGRWWGDKGKRRGKPQNIRILKIADILRDWKMNWGLWPFARFMLFFKCLLHKKYRYFFYVHPSAYDFLKWNQPFKITELKDISYPPSIPLYNRILLIAYVILAIFFKKLRNMSLLITVIRSQLSTFYS